MSRSLALLPSHTQRKAFTDRFWCVMCFMWVMSSSHTGTRPLQDQTQIRSFYKQKERQSIHIQSLNTFNPLKTNDHYRGRTASLTSKRCILYIYSTNIGNEYFKHGIYSPSFSSSKCNLFHDFNVFRSCIIHILYTDALKFKKNSGAKMLTKQLHIRRVHTRRFITGDINGFDSSRWPCLLKDGRRRNLSSLKSKKMRGLYRK